MTTSVSTTATQTHRRWLRRFAGLALALTALWAAFTGFDRWQQERAWREACAEADRLDPGWRWDDLIAARPNPPDERNAALRVRDVRRLLPEPSMPGDIPYRTLYTDISSLPPNQRPRPEQVIALRAAFDSIGPALAKLDGLEGLSSGRLPRHYRSPLLGELMREIEGDIEDARVLKYQLSLYATLLAEDGRADEALKAVRQDLVMASASVLEMTFINALVCENFRIAAIHSLQSVLAQCEPSPDALAATQRLLEAEAEWPLLLETMRAERAMIEDFTRAVDAGPVSQDLIDHFDGNVPQWTGVGTLDLWIHRLRGGGWRRGKAAEMIRYTTALIEIAKESPDALDRNEDAVAAARAKVSPTTHKWVGVEKMREADRRTRALLRSAAAAVAAERFRHDRGRWPLTVGELVPEYVKAVPLDPYDGELLRFIRLADGVAVYSVGPDKVDDGGNVVTSPFGMPSKDVGVRLWDVPFRRLPPREGDGKRN